MGTAGGRRQIVNDFLSDRLEKADAAHGGQRGRRTDGQTDGWTDGRRDKGHLILRVLQSERRILRNRPNEGPRVPSYEHPSDFKVLQSKAHAETNPKAPFMQSSYARHSKQTAAQEGNTHESDGLTRQPRPQ